MYTEYEITLYGKERHKTDMYRAARWRLYKQAKAGQSDHLKRLIASLAALALKAGEQLKATAKAERERKFNPSTG